MDGTGVLMKMKRDMEMKVVQINSVCGIGSTGRIVVEISRMLTQNHIENYILYGVSKSEYPLSIKVGTGLNVRMHQLDTRLLGWHGYASHRATEDLISALARIKPDIIHLHNLHGFYLNMAIMFQYLAETQTKIIWTLHDCWPFTGHCSHFDAIGCGKWRAGCYDCPQKTAYPVSWFFDRSKIQWIDKYILYESIRNLRIVTPSKWLASLVKQSILKEYEVSVINNGIDLEIFKPSISSFREEYSLQDKFIILGVASNWGDHKGLYDFMSLSDRIGSHCQIVLVGLSEKQKKEIPKSILGLNHTENVQELVNIYSAADVFVNPTTEDNFPTVNLEALACGTPVVTYDTGGSAESIDETCGIIVEKGNGDQLVHAVLKSEELPLSKEACRIRAKRYDSKDKFLEYLNLYLSR